MAENILITGNRGVATGGRLISPLEVGAPEGNITFVHTWDDEENELEIEAGVFPSGTTGYRVLLTSPGHLAVWYDGVFDADDTPHNLGNVYNLFVTEGVNPKELVVFIQLVPINGDGVGTPSIRQRISPAPPPPPDIEVNEPAILFAERVGDAFILTPPLYNVEPSNVVTTLQISEDDVVWNSYGSDPSTVPADTESHYLRYEFVVTGPSGDIITAYSNSVGPIEGVESGEDLFQILAEDVIITGSFYDCGGDTWFRPILTLSERLEGRRIRATTTRPDLVPNDGPEIHWSGEVVPLDGQPGFYTIYQNDPGGVNCVITPTRQDFWVFRENAIPARQRIRLSQQPLESDPEIDPWSPISSDHPVAWFVPVPDDPLPDPSFLEWRGIMLRSTAMRGMTPNVPQLDPRGIYPTDGFQWFPAVGSWSADGMKLITGQDSAQLMITIDQGMTCYRPRANGLPLFQIPGVKYDPHPSGNSRMFVFAGAGVQRAQKMGLVGLYRSDDDAENFTRVLALPNSPGRAQNNNDAFAVCPPTGGPGSTWYGAVSCVDLANVQTNSYLVKSTNNGDTWTIHSTLSAGTYGKIYGVATHPTNPDVVYIASGTGLWRSTNGGSSFSRWSNLPNSTISAVWVDPDNADHIIAGVRTGNTGTQGVHETTNGTTFTRIQACRLQHVAVGAADSNGDRTIYVQQTFTGVNNAPATDTPVVRLRNGTWITRATSPGINVNFLGAQDNIMPFNGLTFDGIHHGWFAPHPTDPDYAIYHAKTAFFYTEDGGLNMTLGFGGYTGVNYRGLSFNLTDRLHTVGSTHDVGVPVSETGLDTTFMIRFGAPSVFYSRARAVLGSGSSSNTGRACAILPNDPLLPEVWRNRAFGGFGPSSSSAGVMWYLNRGETQLRDWLGSNPSQGQSNAQGGGVGARSTAGFLFHDPRKAWCGVNRINITGPNTLWTTTGGRIIIGGAQDGTDTIYGYRAASTNIIDRSTDFGANWTQFATFSGNIIGQRNPGVGQGCISEFDGRRMFMRPGNGQTMAMIWDNNGTAQITNFDLSFMYNGISSLPVDARIAEIGTDPLDDRYVYVMNEIMGHGRKIWRGRMNAARTAFDNWEDITLNGPTNSTDGHIHTNPHTGDVMVSHNGMGLYVLPAPEDWQPRVGAFRFSGQPSNGNTLTIAGQTITFVTSGATGLQVNIGGNVNTTVSNLANVLNGSGNGAITPYTYTARGNRLDITIDNPQVNVVETLALSASGTPNATVAFVRQPWKRGYWTIMPVLGQAQNIVD